MPPGSACGHFATGFDKASSGCADWLYSSPKAAHLPAPASNVPGRVVRRGLARSTAMGTDGPGKGT